MHFLKKANGLILGLAVLLAFGCGGDEPEPRMQQPEPYCLITQDSSATGKDIDKYVYDSAGKVIRIDKVSESFGASYLTLDYDKAGTLIQSNINTVNGGREGYDAYQYNAMGLLNQVTSFRLGMTGPQLLESMVVKLSYNAQGKLIERAWFFSSQANHPYWYFQYIHHSDSFIEEKSYKDNDASGDPILDGVGEYRFDNQRNPFLAINPTQLMPNFTDHNLLSRKAFNAAGDFLFEDNFTHQYNAEGYPVKTTISNKWETAEFFYTYNCQ